MGKLLGVLILACSFASAAPILIDFDMTGRPLAEGNEPGFEPWAVGSTTGSASKTVNGITFTVSRNGGTGSAIRSYYWKAGVQAPNSARLIGDALSIEDGDGGASIRVSISGLKAGTHTLQVYHNGIDGKDHSNIKVAVNGNTVINSLKQSNRELIVAKAASSYISFTVSAGQTVNIDYTSLKGGSYNNVFLNNLTLNLPNPAMQAKSPRPGHKDFHADGDDGSITLKWVGGDGAASRDVYLGSDSAAVARADKNSPEFKGNQTATEYGFNGVDLHKIYWWRVDEIDLNGVVTTGQMWSFAPRRLAFRDAEGYGRYARGGRGGKVVKVSNLNDAGPGSLREAVESDIGPRTIIFDVSGEIKLKSRLTINQNNITVAGQTAPGKGILVRDNSFGMAGAEDVIVRFMRVRRGAGETGDGMGMTGSNYCIFDRNSVSWTIDEAFSSRNGKNITLQRTLIAEALNIAGHKNYPAGTGHGYAATISGDTGSFHHNLLAHNAGRNWSLGGGLDGAGYYAGHLDIFNNVVYNWMNRATDGGAHKVNFVNNYYKEGPATALHRMLSADLEGAGKGSQAYYYKGNVLQAANGSFTCDGSNDDCGRRYTLSNGQVLDWNVWNSTPFFPSFAKIQSAKEAYKDVLSDVGANMPLLDDHDQRMIKETLAGNAKYSGSQTKKPGIIDHENDVGGFEHFPSSSRPADIDCDGDGMPDWWDLYIGTNPHSARGDFSESNADGDGSGYTNLERYLDYMATPHLELAVGEKATVNLEDLFKGYEKSPTYSVDADNCVSTQLSGKNLQLTPQTSCGLVKMQMGVKDSENSTKKRDFYVFVKGSEAPVLQKAAAVVPKLQWNILRNQVQLYSNVPGKFVLSNLHGQQVLVRTVQGQALVDLSAYPTGVYVARFSNASICEQKTWHKTD